MYTTPVSTIAGPEGTDVRRMPDERINGLRLGPERPPAGKSFKAVRAWTRDRHGSKQGPGIPLRRGPHPVLRPGRREGPEGPALRRRRAVHRAVRDHLVRDVRVAGLDRRLQPGLPFIGIGRKSDSTSVRIAGPTSSAGHTPGMPRAPGPSEVPSEGRSVDRLAATSGEALGTADTWEARIHRESPRRSDGSLGRRGR